MALCQFSIAAFLNRVYDLEIEDKRVAADTGEVNMKSNYSNLTSEVFSKLCEGRFTPEQVTQEMLDLASTLFKREAHRLIREDGCLAIGPDEVWMDHTISKIEDTIPRCKDRHIVAVLTVAKVWGDDGMSDHSRVY